jgi:hypothetical protein
MKLSRRRLAVSLLTSLEGVSTDGELGKAVLTVLNSKNKPSTKHEKDEYDKIST